MVFLDREMTTEIFDILHFFEYVFNFFLFILDINFNAALHSGS